MKNKKARTDLSKLLVSELITLNEAAKVFPSAVGKKKPSFSTIFRWTQKGVGGQKLASIKIGGQRYTSEKSVRDFIAAANSELV